MKAVPPPFAPSASSEKSVVREALHPHVSLLQLLRSRQLPEVAMKGAQRQVSRPSRYFQDQAIRKSDTRCSSHLFRRRCHDVRVPNGQLQGSELRREVAWKRKHGSSFTAKWLGGRLVLSLYVIAIATSFGFWLFTPDGRTFRVAVGVGSIDVKGGTRVERSFITSDMTQHEIDSIAATVRANQAPARGP